MNSAKIFLVFGVIAIATIGCLRIAGFISSDLASDTLGRSLGIVAILGISVGTIGLVLGKGSKKNDSSGNSQPGPKF